MAKVRVLVVDDSLVVRSILSNILASDPEIEVVGTAPNGKSAINKVETLAPDIVTLDLEMPELNGIETLKLLRRAHPLLKVLMVSSFTERGAASTLEAISLGAVDYVTKPATGQSSEQAIAEFQASLLPKIKALAPREKLERLPASRSITPEARSTRLPKNYGFEALVIGVSTGGPNALASFLSKLPANYSLPIAVVQHMPALFTTQLAIRLDKVCPLKVKEAIDGEVFSKGTVYIAPGDYHLEIQREAGRNVLRTSQGPAENFCRPAADVLFRSAAKVFGAHTLAVVLTGMGQDGLHGSESIVEAGGLIIAQDKESSVVWGMPGAVAERGLAEAVLPLSQIANKVIELAGKPQDTGKQEILANNVAESR